MDEFVENYLQKNMGMIEKTLKKYEQKLRNIKKMALIVKDKNE